MITIPDILDDKQIDELVHAMLGAELVSGEVTAGKAAKLVKNNLQMSPSDELLSEMQQIAATMLVQNQAFQLYARPLAVVEMLFSRYDIGHEYGWHVDNPMMRDRRVDLAFTIPLTSNYEGGWLEITDGDSVTQHKPDAGSVIVYPATSLHRVTPVTAGYRLAAVGWIKSYVRNHEHRQLLFDLDIARREIFERPSCRAQYDRLSRVSANLTRMWIE